MGTLDRNQVELVDTATASNPTVTDDASVPYRIGALWINTATKEQFVLLDASVGAAIWAPTAAGGGSTTFNLAIGGCLASADLPLSGAGREIVNSVATLTRFQARRGTQETSGTTTVLLELNGTPIGSATLSWTSADAVNALKSVVISQAVAVGDSLTLRLTSAGVDAEDIHAEVGT